MRRVVRLPLAEDTPLEIEVQQVAIWRTMSIERKRQLISGVYQRVNALTYEGVRRRHPHAAPREVFLRVAIVRLGYEVAVEAFPDAAGLEP